MYILYEPYCQVGNLRPLAVSVEVQAKFVRKPGFAVFLGKNPAAEGAQGNIVNLRRKSQRITRIITNKYGFLLK